MKHHQTNSNYNFVVDPIDFDKDSSKEFLQYCLGATLYMPGTKYIVDKLLSETKLDATSIVMDFEDAIDERYLKVAENSVLEQLNSLLKALETENIKIDELPLIFLRVRNTGQFKKFTQRLKKEQAELLSGFTFPKFTSNNCVEYFYQLENLNQKFDLNLYAMPILEGKTIAYKEMRVDELLKIRDSIEPFKNWILNLRVGGTDFSSFFGVRRGINYSIYDILPVNDCLSDILNIFTREESDYTVSGPVWEYFLAYKTDNLDNFVTDDIHRSLLTRTPILNDAVDGLMREVILDKANGFIGKTIIHPSHAKYVNSMQAVIREEYEDAQQILKTPGGVIKSNKLNKMNEINPHSFWAKKVIRRAEAYGVIEDEKSYLKLLLSYN
jgi:citrate lyase beta subunit